MITISTNPIYPDLENKFPTDIDEIKRFVDPAIEDLQTINQYYNNIDAGNLIAASAILDANPKLKQMVLNAGTLNPLIDAIISMQRYYITDIQQYLVNIVKQKGDWNANTRYTKYDVVQYVNNGGVESYMGIVTTIPIGTLPTNSDYFVALTMRGEQGVSGTGLSPRGSWSSIAEYHLNDCVAYNNVLWYAKADNINKPPQDVSDYWEAILRIPNQIVISDTEPVGQSLDQIWFKTLTANAFDVYRKKADGTYELILPNANNALTANNALNANSANTAQKLQTARLINGVSFDGSSDINLTPSNISAAPAIHTHAPADLTAAVPIAKGGTGATTANAARANLGAVSKAGDTLTGDLQWTDSSKGIVWSVGGYNAKPIRVYAGDANGAGIVIGAGGRTIIGSGESADNLRTVIGGNEGTEVTYIASDQQIEFYTNCQTIGNRKGVQINTNGALIVPDNTDYGTAKARNIYAGTGDMTAGSTALGNGVIYLVYE